MTGKSFIAKGINVSSRVIEDIAYIYLEDKKELVQLNEVGSFVWACITGHRTVNQIILMCCDRYDDPSGQIPEIIMDFLEELKNESFVESSTTKFEGVMAND